MKFEDLFKTKEPTNYVEQSSGGQDPLAKFFAERTVKAQKAKQPITPEKEMAIKKTFTLPPAPPKPEIPQEDGMDQAFNETVANEGQLQEAPVEAAPIEQPKLEIPDLAPKKEESLSDRAEKMLPERTWKDYLPFLTPLLVEGLMGVNADSAGIAGSALMGHEADRIKRKQTLEDKLLEMDKAKLTKKSSNGKLQLKPLRNKTTGEPIMGNYDPSTGSMYVNGQAVDTADYELAPGLSTQEFQRRQDIAQKKQKEIGDYFTRGLTKDPESGLFVIVRNGKVIPLQVPASHLNPTQRKELSGIISNFKSTDAYKKNSISLSASRVANELLNQARDTNNPTAAEMARRELAKMAEGGGKLSDQDVAALGGSRAYKDQLKRWSNLQRTGAPLLPQDIKFMQIVSNAIEREARKNLQQSISGLEDDFIQRGGVPGAVQTSMRALAPNLYSNSSVEPSVNSDKVRVEKLDSNGRPTGKFGFIPRSNLQRGLKEKKIKVAE